eukprot:6463177-Amphidinium_carterae.1
MTLTLEPFPIEHLRSANFRPRFEFALAEVKGSHKKDPVLFSEVLPNLRANAADQNTRKYPSRKDKDKKSMKDKQKKPKKPKAREAALEDSDDEEEEQTSLERSS